MDEKQRIRELESMIASYKKTADECEIKATMCRKEQLEMEEILKGLLWEKGIHEIKLQQGSLCANYDTWEQAKNTYKKAQNPEEAVLFFMEDQHDDHYLSFSVADAREIITYLKEKIAYLEE
jgi:hypothetical protein